MNAYTYEQLTVGREASFTAGVTEEMMDAFCRWSGDVNPLHCNAQYAKESGFPGRVVYGMLVSSFYSTLAGVYLPGERCLLHGVDAKFHKPVFVGDMLTVSGVVAQKHDAFQTVAVKATVTNQKGEVVSTAVIRAGVRLLPGEHAEGEQE